ncbi:Dual specificity protein phosphatase 3 [Bulinus truncatus]|nr:Dual specificity protein phosphatase 3 [Bulinus truncatus]
MNTFDENRPCTIEELQNIITAPSGGFTMLPNTEFDEICDGILLGEGDAAKNISYMKKLGITHVLNAALGKDAYHVNTNHVMYQKKGIKFLGIEATDMMNFDMAKYFYAASDFIQEGITIGKVFVHCVQGVSRSATLVIAYLMIKSHMTVQDAVRLVRSKREISPNPGFLQQLCNLNEKLKKSGNFPTSNENCIDSNGRESSIYNDAEICTVQELEDILSDTSNGYMMLPSTSFSQIDENIALGESNFIDRRDRLQRFGITHVLNAAYIQGSNADTSQYEQVGINFLGIAAEDTLSFDIAACFEPAADFIEDAVKMKGCAFIHCVRGVSCSATLLIAYLMIKKHLRVQAAVRFVRSKREICPNGHFLQQLCDLHFKLTECGHFSSSSKW